MKKSFNFILYLIILVIMNYKALAEIITTTSLTPLKEAISKSQHNTWIIFDVDEVILTPEDQLFHPHYIDRLMKFDKELATRLKKEEIDNLWSQLFKTRKAVLVDNEFPKILKLIEKKQRHSFALTKCNTGSFGSISKFEDWRINELKGLGVNFSSLSPFKEEIIFNYSDTKNGVPLYKEGVIFTCYKDKGEVLEDFLKKIILKPANIIFIDDKLENLLSVEKICNKLKIEFLGIHYKLLEEKPHAPLNEEKAKLQLHILETEKRWVSDKELNINSAIPNQITFGGPADNKIYIMSEKELIIRDAIKDDSSQLVRLLEQLGPKFKMSVKKMENRVEAFKSKGHQLKVAQKEGEIIGLIAFGCYEQFRLPGSCCHIDTLIVDNKYRGKGIGKKLIAYAEQYAFDYGAVTIELITANHRRSTGTHAFYESLGYKDHIALDYSYFAKEKVF